MSFQAEVVQQIWDCSSFPNFLSLGRCSLVQWGPTCQLCSPYSSQPCTQGCADSALAPWRIVPLSTVLRSAQAVLGKQISTISWLPPWARNAYSRLLEGKNAAASCRGGRHATGQSHKVLACDLMHSQLVGSGNWLYVLKICPQGVHASVRLWLGLSLLLPLLVPG